MRLCFLLLDGEPEISGTHSRDPLSCELFLDQRADQLFSESLLLFSVLGLVPCYFRRSFCFLYL